MLGCYVILADEDDFDFAECVQTFTDELEAQMKKSVLLGKHIHDNLAKMEININDKID